MFYIENEKNYGFKIAGNFSCLFLISLLGIFVFERSATTPADTGNG
jgi:hypothetical protein